MSTLVGGCQCGQVRYESNAQPLFSGNCHCRECQKATGGAYVPALAIPANSLKVTGEVKYYENRADSGNTFSRGFVPTVAAEFSGRPLDFRSSF